MLSTKDNCIELVRNRNKLEQKSRYMVGDYSKLMTECQQLRTRCKGLESDNRRLSAMVGAIGKLEIPENTKLDLEQFKMVPGLMQTMRDEY